MTWDEYFVDLLEPISKKSKDKTKCSAIIVGQKNEIISTGYNGMVRGMDESDLDKWIKPEKYYWVEHAERNAIYNATRVGTSTDSCTIYASHLPCVDCSRAIIQAGIVRVVISSKNIEAFKHSSSMYFEHEKRTKEMFRQCEISFNIFGED